MPASLLLALHMQLFGQMQDAGSSVPGRAASPAPVCARLPGKGLCHYEGRGAGGTLLVYLRGHHPEWRGAVARENWDASLRELFHPAPKGTEGHGSAYGLFKTADQAGVTLLATASSDVAVEAADVDALERTLRKRFETIVVASHSGGNASLADTLRALPQTSRIILLDTLYYCDGAAIRRLAQTINRGAACAGFNTRNRSRLKGCWELNNNLERFEALLKPKVADRCLMEDHTDDYNHFLGVGKCLGPYLEGKPCR
jgi:hypothetical protein